MSPCRNIPNWRHEKVVDSEPVDEGLQQPLHNIDQAGPVDSVPTLVIQDLGISAYWPRSLYDPTLAGSEEANKAKKIEAVNKVDKDGRDFLQNAVESYSEAAIKPFLRGDRNFETIDKDRRTPPYIAAEFDKGAEIEAADKDGRAVVQLTSAIPQDFAEYHGTTVWEGLETYRKCDGAISDVLTISGLDSPQSHCYIVRSVSEFLTEYYPAFGLEILNWIIRICKRCQELETVSSLHNSIRMRSDMSQEVVVMGAAYIILTGHLEDRTLSWAISTNSEELALDFKSALTWTLSALQSQPQNKVGLFSGTPGSLDIGLPKRTVFKPTRAESYCWTHLFSYAYIALLPSLNFKDRPATEGLEIDFSLLLELAAVDQKIFTEEGLLLFGFDTALIPLEPPESRRWHFLVTEGIQITPARVNKEFGKRKEKNEGDFRFQGILEPEYQNGNVYVGWCTAPVAKIETIELDRTPVDHHISLSSGVCNVKKLEESVERSSRGDVFLLPYHRSLRWRKNRYKKFQQVNFVAKRTEEVTPRVSLRQQKESALIKAHMLQADKADGVVDEIVVGDTYCEEDHCWVRLQ